MLIGGAEDKSGDKTVLKEVLNLCEGKNVVVVPAASNYPDDVYRNYEYAFRDLGVASINKIDVRYKEDADRPENLEKLMAANLIFFGGGDQVKLVEIFNGTNLLTQIIDRFNNAGLTIAGTSAGAAAASNPMLYDGDYKGFRKGSINSGQGFGLIEGITIDTHFLNRERIPRLTQYLLSGYSSRGIGLDEDTGIVVYPDNKFRVIGSGTVTLINTDRVTYSNYDHLEKDKLYSVNNLRMGFLASGAMFNLKKWSVMSNVEVAAASAPVVTQVVTEQKKKDEKFVFNLTSYH